MFSRYVWLLPLLLGIIYYLYSHDFIKKIRTHFADGHLNIIDMIHIGLDGNSNEQKIFTTSELQQYTSIKNGLYLSILGQVYDVTKGENHYGPGGNYHIFTGNYKPLPLCWKRYYIYYLFI